MRFLFIYAISLILSVQLTAQDITFIPRETSVNDTIGDEVVMYIDITNISQSEQTVFVVRTLNQMPSGWSTSLCFDYCYPDWVDSIATTPDFGSSPLQPGETREVSVHFFTNNVPNSGMVQLQAGTFRNPDQRITVELQASTFDPTSVDYDIELINNFELSQNYPNPFNPSTKIQFTIGSSQIIQLKIYDTVGREITTLISGYKSAGTYELTFNSEDYNIPSGIYFYRLTAGTSAQTKAMILEK